MAEFTLARPVHHDIYPFISPKHALEDAAEGRSVLITGAGTGIGKATAEVFAQASAANIILIGRRLEVIEKVRDDLSSKYPDCTILARKCDVSKREDIDRVFSELKELKIEIDVLINNAGVNLARSTLKESEVEDWWKTFKINLKGPYIVTRAFLRQHTPGKPAAVIMTSTIGSYYQVPLASAYGTSKAALNRITEWIASENKEDGVQAVALHPGGVAGTDLTSKAPAFMQQYYTETPELGPGAILYLSTQRASYLSGRYVDARWDLEELEKVRDKIEREDLLKLSLLGDERGRL